MKLQIQIIASQDNALGIITFQVDEEWLAARLSEQHLMTNFRPDHIQQVHMARIDVGGPNWMLSQFPT